MNTGKEKERLIVEHKTHELWPLLLKRQIKIMLVLPKIATLAPSISDRYNSPFAELGKKQ